MIKIIKPLNDKIIPVPEYNYSPLPKEGMELHITPYWNARIADGDVVIEDLILTEKKTKKESV